MKKLYLLFCFLIQLSCAQKTPEILEAVANDDTQTITTFLKQDHDINANYNGYTLLTYSIKKNPSTSFIQFLLSQGAHIDQPNGSRKNALMYAAKYHRNDLIPFLVKHGANVNLQNDDGANALLYAIKYENGDGLKKLIALGGDIHKKLDGNFTILDYAKKRNSKIILKALNLEYKEELAIDGPYLFYRDNNTIENIAVVTTNNTPQVTSSILANKNTPLNVMVDNNSQDQFTVQLQDSLYIPNTAYNEPEKLIAISDIEGNFYALKQFLIGSGVMDNNYQWSYGSGHLVLVGDFFDRGTNVTAVLWLLYDLDRQAKAHNGMVHFIVGNHEIMNLNGDNRYVRNKYKELALKLDTKTQELYSENTELGRWLRTKNCVEKIGNTVYTHGGLSKRLVDDHFSLQEMNDLARAYYGKSNQEIIKNDRAKGVFSSNAGPFWYRGYFKENLPQSEVDAITNYYKIDHIVVGHTPVKEISSLYENTVIAIDLKHPNNKEHGLVKGLLKINNQFYSIDELGNRSKL